MYLFFFIASAGGAELIASLKSDDACDVGRTYYITAAHCRLLHAAEKFKIVKKTIEGHKEEFVFENRHMYQGYRDKDDDFLYSAEKQFLILQCLKDMTAADMGFIPGVPKATLYKDRPVGK